MIKGEESLVGSLDGRVAVVTGAGRGIGAAVARRLAVEGAAVVVNDLGVALDGATLADSPAEGVAREIRDAGGAAVANANDVADAAGAEELIRTAVEQFGKLDVLVNVAGILRDRMIFNMSEDEWDSVIRVHLRGHFNTIKPAAGYWRDLRQPDGNYRIINFASDSGLFGAPGQPNYAAAKMGIVGLTYSCARALGRYGVTTNAIAPVAATRMTQSVPLYRRKMSQESAELAPANVAPMVVYLAGAASGWCNGHVFGAGGYRIALYSDPVPLREIHNAGPWEVDQLSDVCERVFRPAVRTNPQ